MPRIQPQLPEKFAYSVNLRVRITDINYGGHMGNHNLLGLVHEARMSYLNSLGYSELEMGGVSLIMSAVSIAFKQEAFYNDELIIEVAAGDFSKVAFEVYYRISKSSGDKLALVAAAQTSMVCYDYKENKIKAIPPEVVQKLTVSLDSK